MSILPATLEGAIWKITVGDLSRENVWEHLSQRISWEWCLIPVIPVVREA
jgi:hypothetical protein